MQKPIVLTILTFLSLNLNSQTMAVNPNPVYQNAIVSFTLANADSLSIIVTDITGKIVLTPRSVSFLAAGVYQDSLLMSNLQNGIYYVLLKTHSAKALVTKVIKAAPTSIPYNNNSITLKLYPNPVHEKLTLESDFQIENTEFILFTSTGKEIYRGTLNSKPFELNCVDLPKGIYFLRLQNLQIQTVVKIIKE